MVCIIENKFFFPLKKRHYLVCQTNYKSIISSIINLFFTRKIQFLQKTDFH
jgi:hypothetical protein